jgi:DNA (cytosine-5)-methyltransferase 1
MRAIDLYSGVGGWGLGLKLAGFDVLASYERSATANETNSRNNRHVVVQADVRSLDPNALPDRVEAVVGSPPCTQFSFSNRGGAGDISDGISDIFAFLSIVDHLRPRVWAMENVPRVADIISAEVKPGGRLSKFSHLGINHAVFDLEEFGLPQKRKRCIVGNLDLDLLFSYRKVLRTRTLGEVIVALQGDSIVDPIFDYSIPASSLYDHLEEESLDTEEVRINRSLKALHPIYNTMQFPDRLDRPSRTITATCTRVSRESIVVQSPGESDAYRRLTVRERACCQGFPVSFQFYCENYSEKLRMVGNAIPPLFAYYVAHAMRGTPPDRVRQPTFKANDFGHIVPPSICPPNRRTQRYRPDRSFQFAVPSLHLKSGVRFELNNGTRDGPLDWHVRFVFGTSKDIRVLRPDAGFARTILEAVPEPAHSEARRVLGEFSGRLQGMDFLHLQSVWSHRGPGITRPFMLLDAIDETAVQLKECLIAAPGIPAVDSILPLRLNDSMKIGKLIKHSPAVLSGLIVGGIANDIIARKLPPKPSIAAQEAAINVG